MTDKGTHQPHFITDQLGTLVGRLLIPTIRTRQGVGSLVPEMRLTR